MFTGTLHQVQMRIIVCTSEFKAKHKFNSMRGKVEHINVSGQTGTFTLLSVGNGFYFCYSYLFIHYMTVHSR